MKPRIVKDQLEKIADVVDLNKPITDEKFVDLRAKLQSFRPNTFEDRIADIRQAKEGVTSELVSRLLMECEQITLSAVQQYHRQLYFLSQSFFDEFEDLQKLRSEASKLSVEFGSSPPPAQTSLLGEVAESVEYFQDSLSAGKLKQDEVCDSFVLIASDLFETILPIENNASHIETARDTLWTTLSTFTTMGLLEYVKVVRRAYPTRRRNLELKGANQSMSFYETYYKAMVDWDQSSKAWQIRVELGLS